MRPIEYLHHDHQVPLSKLGIKSHLASLVVIVVFLLVHWVYSDIPLAHMEREGAISIWRLICLSIKYLYISYTIGKEWGWAMPIQVVYKSKFLPF